MQNLLLKQSTPKGWMTAQLTGTKQLNRLNCRHDSEILFREAELLELVKFSILDKSLFRIIIFTSTLLKYIKV